MSEPLVLYVAYELVHREDRAILAIPAPGAAVYLAADIDTRLAELAQMKRINFDHETGFHAAQTEITRLQARVQALTEALQAALPEIIRHRQEYQDAGSEYMTHALLTLEDQCRVALEAGKETP